MTSTFTICLPSDFSNLANFYLLALCIYREARGEIMDSKVAVGWVIKNRTLKPSWYGHDWFTVITAKEQFSSFNLGEVNSIVFPPPTDNAWKDSVTAAFNVMAGNVADPTMASLYYFDKSLDKNPPAWAKTYHFMVDIGNFHFYRP